MTIYQKRNMAIKKLIFIFSVSVMQQSAAEKDRGRSGSSSFLFMENKLKISFQKNNRKDT